MQLEFTTLFFFTGLINTLVETRLTYSDQETDSSDPHDDAKAFLTSADFSTYDVTDSTIHEDFLTSDEEDSAT